MMESDDELERRRSLTFEQAEGFDPLPRQLKRDEVSASLRAIIWALLYDEIRRAETSYSDEIANPWRAVMFRLHVTKYHLPADQFSARTIRIIDWLRPIIYTSQFQVFYGFLQTIIRDPDVPVAFRKGIIVTLDNELAGYRVIDRTLVPIASREEGDAIAKAVTDLTEARLTAAGTHLLKAGAFLNNGDYSSSVRESIHAVESTARSLVPGSTKLDAALAELSKGAPMHSAFEAGIKKLYGYTSDEQGVRHASLNDGITKVDEADALFMLGACASFCSFLTNKARQAGLLK